MPRQDPNSRRRGVQGPRAPRSTSPQGRERLFRYRAVGPLGRALNGQTTDSNLRKELAGKLKGANLLVLLRRVHVAVDGGGDGVQQTARAAMLDAAMTPDPELDKLCVAVQARRRLAIEWLQQRGYHSVALTVSPQWRLIVGLSAETPLEVGLALHGTYGVSILPASSLKGLANRVQPSATVFGSPDRQGSVILLDGLPNSPVRLCQDVMTPHVGRYYSNPAENPPAEYWAPVPVTFLAAPSEAKFTAYLLTRDQADLDTMKQAVVGGLRELGLGAKTAAGYGYCDVSEEKIQARGGETL